MNEGHGNRSFDSAREQAPAVEKPHAGIFERIQRLSNKRILRAFALIAMAYGMEQRGSAQTHQMKEHPIDARDARHEAEKVEPTPGDWKSELTYLAGELGSTNAYKLIEIPSIPSADQRLEFEMRPHSIDVVGFKEAGINPHEVLDYVGSLPKFLSRNVDEIQYVNQLTYEEKESRYGKDVEGKQKLGKCDEPHHKLFLYKHSHVGPDTFENLKGTLVHELMHLAGPYFNRFLTKEERLRTQVMLIYLERSPDHYMTGYLKNIHNPDKQKELLIKTQERWAETGEAYFSGQRALLPDAERKLIEYEVALTDPHYVNVTEAVAAPKPQPEFIPLEQQETNPPKTPQPKVASKPAAPEPDYRIPGGVIKIKKGARK